MDAIDTIDTLYADQAHDYESIRREVGWDPFVHVKEVLGGRDLNGLDVLDAGCGTGEVTRYLAGLGARPVGVDITGEMCYEAAMRSENIPFMQHDLSEPLPFGDDRFDVVVALGCLEYIENIADTIAEFGRVLRSGGVFLGCFERYGEDCPGGTERNAVLFDYWMRYRQNERELEAMLAPHFRVLEMKRVHGFRLEDSGEYTQYIRVSAVAV